MNRMPCDRGEVDVICGSDDVDSFHESNVKDSCGMVSGTGSQESLVSVGLEPNFGDSMFEVVNGGDTLSVSRVPELDQIIF
ncbi:hypothetical protein OGAPHI_007355 [Ogataea philodendri]|uniref:Uncharacterized protein n=1 Tax=Ogataea philodendri TaxID=1378263 RepID=A0A9P8NUW6_9ASCO|nr:uncharacterized protein OGAPHI_007355 [Ogataea philodendri]KAH3660150.1 hypothetical protein OGAPHI_007355 [Ogataea philodendri]